MGNLVARSVALASGIRLSCAEQGAGGGAPLLLLHGYGDSWRAFGPVLASLPPSRRAIALSLRGHGDSDKPADGYRIADFAADVIAFMDRLDLPPAALVGHSMGSLVAMRAALDRPGRVAGLVLIGAFATLKGNAAAEELWRTAVAGFGETVDPGFVREFQQGTLARPVEPAFFEGVVAESLKLPAAAWRAALAAMLADDFSDELGRISAPTLLLWGELDSFSGRAEQERLAALIPGARLVAYKGAGHAPHWEDPARAAADLAGFAASLAELTA